MTYLQSGFVFYVCQKNADNFLNLLTMISVQGMVNNYTILARI